MKLWMQVTQDEYELPIVVAGSSRELAEQIGKTDTYIRRSVSEFERGLSKRCKYRKVEIEDDNCIYDLDDVRCNRIKEEHDEYEEDD